MGEVKVTYEETWKLATATVTRECLGGRSRKKLRAPRNPDSYGDRPNFAVTKVEHRSVGNLEKKTFLIVT